MRIENLSHGMITVSMTSDDCGALARGLRAAVNSEAFIKRGQEVEGMLVENLANMFKIATFACLAHGWLKGQEEVAEELYRLGLGDLLGISDEQGVMLQIKNRLKYPDLAAASSDCQP